MQDDSAARGDLKAAEAQLHEAMRAHAAQLQSRPAAAAIDAAAPRNDAPVKVKIRVTLDEVSLRLTCGGKGLNKSLLDACVVPFLGAYNKRVETHKQCTLEELMSAKINGDMLGRRTSTKNTVHIGRRRRLKTTVKPMAKRMIS